MEYGCQVWNPHQHGNIDLLERVRFKGELLTGVVVVGGTPHGCHASRCLPEGITMANFITASTISFHFILVQCIPQMVFSKLQLVTVHCQ